MNPGDRVIYHGGLGWNRVHATVVRAAIEFNPRGHEDIDGFWVRPDGWDHDHFVAASELERAP